MRRFTFKEKEIINKLIDYSSSQCFSVYQFISEQDIYTTKGLLEVAFTLWFLEENGYIYTQSTPKIIVIEDPNIKMALYGLYESLRQRVDSLLQKVVFVTDQLRSLRDNQYQSLEEEQLNLTQSILDNATLQTAEALNQTKEAKNQTKEALNQTDEALKQTTEALRQTRLARYTFILSFLTFLASLIIPNLPSKRHAEKNQLLQDENMVTINGTCVLDTVDNVTDTAISTIIDTLTILEGNQ